MLCRCAPRVSQGVIIDARGPGARQAEAAPCRAVPCSEAMRDVRSPMTSILHAIKEERPVF